MRIESTREKYLNEIFGQQDAELASIRDELHRHDLDFMSISGYEARLLQFFVRACGVRKIVEFGTLFGYSALAMAKALPDTDSVLYTLEKNPVNHEIAKRHFTEFPTHGRKVRALCGDAHELMLGIENDGPFDLVFIDADKSSYCDYLDWALKNVRRGGFIAGDNSFLWGGVYDEPTDRNMSGKQIAAMKTFNTRLADPTKFNSTLIPTSEGLTIAQVL